MMPCGIRSIVRLSSPSGHQRLGQLVGLWPNVRLHAAPNALSDWSLSTFLYHGMVAHDVPVDCICARHAKGIVAAQVNESAFHDAEGIAQMARTSWFKRIQVPDV